jgi:aspartate/methionine/tyrosine aminotransferase
MSIHPSPTAIINNIVLEKKQRGEKIFSLNIGEPVMLPHQILKDAALFALDNGKTLYAPIEGLIETRASACQWMNQVYHTQYDTSQVLVTCGGKYGIFLLLQTLLKPQDEVLLIAPYYVSYPGMVEMCGGVPISIDSSAERGWKVTSKDIEAKCSRKTRILIINNAANPTGVLYTRQELEDILHVAQQHHLIVLSDEVYSGLTYEGDFISCGSFPEYQDTVCVIQSCSKHFAMTGWRVGFVFAHPGIIQQIAILQGQSITGTSTISQWVAHVALDQYKVLMPWVHDNMKKRRNVFVETWNSLFSQSIPYPASSLYAFLPTSFMDARDHNSVHLCQKILEKTNVALVPGIAFGKEEYIRFSFGGTEESIQEALINLHSYLV